MSFVWVGGGVVIVAVGLLDVFLTVLHYENPGFAVPAYRAVWASALWLTGPLPRGPQARARSMIAPTMVAMTLVVWLAVPVLGFSLIYWPAIAHRDFAVGHAGHSFGTAVYFSAATLTSLSFSDVQPVSLAYHAVAAMETLVGLGILTLSISYVLNLYRVLQDQGILATLLLQHSGGGNNPIRLLESHFIDGRPEGLSTLVRELDRNLTEHREGMRRHPLVWYFHTRRLYRSLPYIFWFTGAAAAALRWGLPKGHPASRDPWLPGLIAGYDDAITQISAQFLGSKLPDSPNAVPSEAFAVAGREGKVDDDMLRRFLEIDAAMGAMAQATGPEDPTERYERYREWTRFVGRARSFVEATSRQLGLDPDLLYEDPRRVRF
ncbi:MAG TPA: potassium channel family protein [Acidimicrobiales bacterium]|nr:potassium channel family protein [Acidimicrobiales bacterium]